MATTKLKGTAATNRQRHAGFWVFCNISHYRIYTLTVKLILYLHIKVKFILKQTVNVEQLKIVLNIWFDIFLGKESLITTHQCINSLLLLAVVKIGIIFVGGGE